MELFAQIELEIQDADLMNSSDIKIDDVDSHEFMSLNVDSGVFDDLRQINL